MADAQNIFKPYLGAPVTSQCYKELGQKIQQYSQSEREALFASFHPKELHLQLLKLTAARTSGCHLPLLNGLKAECKFVSKFSLKSKLLYNGTNKELLDVNFLIPLLQTVSATTRNRILWNLGKYVQTSETSQVSVDNMDTLYGEVSKIWGSNIASPLVCQTSKGILERELPNVEKLSGAHLLVIAKKFPFLALSFLEQNRFTDHSLKAARYIVGKTMPKSFDYIVKQESSFLSKSMMKMILRNHSKVVLESPSAWLNVLDKDVVKKALKPELCNIFLTKIVLEIKNMDVPSKLLSYFELLSPSEVSSIMKKVFPEKYGCTLGEKLEFWDNNVGLLKLLDASDRSFIAVALSTRDPLSPQWLPLMTTDLSIPKIKKLLYTEQGSEARAELMLRLIETALLNKDQIAIVDICNLVVTRYRNDRCTLQDFFRSDLDFSLLSKETFDLVFAAANRFYDPDDWQTESAAKLFPLAIKRNWDEAGVKEYLAHFMKGSQYFSISDLHELKDEFRLICIDEIFTAANLEDEDMLRRAAKFLALITLWTKSSTLPLINDNVKKFTLAMLKTYFSKSEATTFMCANLGTLNLEFIEECFKSVPNPIIMTYLFSKKSHVLMDKDILKMIGTHILEKGVHGFSALLTKMKKLGHIEMLNNLANESKKTLANTETTSLQNYTNAVVLLMLTSCAEDYFSIIDPILPSTENNLAEGLKASGDSNNKGRYYPLNASKREDAIYYGFGISISRLGIPALAVERMRRFCVNGDLMLFVRDALYSVSSSLPNDKAKALLLSLMKQPVSVKKHALRLLWRTVCNIDTQEVLLLKLIETEEHLTMRIILMDTAITLLNVCKYLSMWKVVKEMMNKLTPDDKTIVLQLVFKKIPDPFLEEYYQILLLKSKVLLDVDKSSVFGSILAQILCSVAKMSEKFIESLIAENFLGKSSFGNSQSHSCISNLLVSYLQGKPASNLPVNQQDVEPRRTLRGRQQFLKDRLDSCTIEGTRDVFDPTQGDYIVRSLLLVFIESLCNSCLEERHSEPSHDHQLIKYIDFLLSYLEKFNQNAVVWASIILSATKVLNINSSETPFVVGQKLGELTDSMFRKSSVALFCYFPAAMAYFFNSYVTPFSSLPMSQVLDIYRGILSTVPPGCGTLNSPEDMCNMLRLMTVAHTLPSKWLVDDEYKEFRQTFLVLVRNTPAEVFLINAK